MDEVAARAVRAVAEVVEGSAGLGLVLRMTKQSTQLRLTMSKLAFVAIFAAASLLEATAQFSLVTVGRLHREDLSLKIG